MSAAFAQAQDLKVSEAEAKKAAIEKHTPQYSLTARQLKLSGRVEVVAVVEPNGGVAKVNIVSGNPVLAASVVEAVKQWRFTPFSANGKPSRALASLSFDFRL